MKKPPVMFKFSLFSQITYIGTKGANIKNIEINKSKEKNVNTDIKKGE